MAQWQELPTALLSLLPGSGQDGFWLLAAVLVLLALMLVGLFGGRRAPRLHQTLPRLDGTLLPDGSFLEFRSTRPEWLDFPPSRWQQAGFLASLVPPDERQRLEQYLDQLDGLPNTGLALRLTGDDGRDNPVLVLARRITGKHGPLVELSLCALDHLPPGEPQATVAPQASAVLQALPDSLLLLDGGAVIRDASSLFCELTGLARSELIDVPLAHLPFWQGVENVDGLCQSLQQADGQLRSIGLPFIGLTVTLQASALGDGSGYWLLHWRPAEASVETDQLLRRSEERLHQVFEAMPDALMLSRRRDGCLLEVNGGFTRLCGFTRDQALGKTTLELGLWPDQSDRLRLLQGIVADGRVEQLVLPFRGRDGQILRCEFNSQLLNVEGEECLLSLVRDTTERELLQDRLRQAAAVFESTAEAVIIMDMHQKVVAVNRAFSAITGFGESEVLGRSPHELGTLLNDEECLRQVSSAVQHDGHWQGEIWSRRKNGESYPAWLTLSAVRDGSHQITHQVAVFADITSLKQAQARLDHQANHDPLTGLPNRALFENRLLRAIGDALMETHEGAVLFLDLDGFKHINDSLGHPVGDELLRQIAHRLRECLREVDVVARLGGDEFIVLMPALHDLKDVELVSGRLMASFKAPFHAGGHEFFITASMGISLFPRNGSEVATLVKSADAAMYRAKARGRNRIEYYSDELGALATERVVLENDLRRAIALGQMYLVFQPKLSLVSGQLTGAEVLLRWKHPEHGEIPPERFIPIAEDSGCIIELGSWVLEETCRQIRHWQQLYLPFGALAVNLAGAQIAQPDLAQRIRGLLDRHDLDPECLELEITETFIMNQAGEVLPVLCELRELGLKLSIDDFGTGYSSLSYLKRLPVHTLKIDKSFIDGLPDDAEDVAIARAIIALGRSMHLTVVAEGVETKAQERFLTLEGCQQIQGYLVSRPLRAASFAEQFLQRRQTLGDSVKSSL